MRILLICVGRLKEKAECDLVERYMQRCRQLGPSLGVGETNVIELTESKARTASARKDEEAAWIREKIPSGAGLIALDERGATVSSAEFARRLGGERDRGVRTLCLVIGGPDGLDQGFVKEADISVSFGRMTLPHGLMRAVLAEQLYRALTILAGHPYHRE